MDAAKLRYMAEQIARNLAIADEAEAIAATARHIRDFWDPRMQAAILDEDREGLSPVLAAALDRLAAS